MADAQNNMPPVTSTPSKTSRPANQGKRNPRNKSRQHQSLPQVDGAVSDSVTNPSSTPQAKRTPKPRHQSVALGAPPPNSQPHIPARVANEARQRPSSLGGNTLPATPLKEQAYAGPTFQVSPAPSSLPVPKFFSRSVPNVAAQSSLAQRMEAERTPEERSSPEPDVVDPGVPNRDQQKSPLDLFFNADRVERERSRSGLSPELTRMQNGPNGQHRGSQQSNNGIFLSDNGSNASYSPKSLPLVNDQQNQRPVTSPHVGMHTNSSATASEAETDTEAQTKALKALLFNNINDSPASPNFYTTPSPEASNSRAPYTVYETPSPSQRSTSGPSTPAPSNESQYQNPNYHYGNQRNLSPLFKAASGHNKVPTPRPSGLRQQQMVAGDSPAGFQYDSPQPARVDPNAFSRNFLQQHINGSGVGVGHSQSNGVTSPPPPGQSPHGSIPMNGSPPVTNPRRAPNGAPNSVPNGTSVSPSTTQSRDTKGMEDDLRRMLNLNVVSN